MNYLLIIYIFLLFVFFNYALLLTNVKNTNKYLVATFLFGIVFYFTHNFVIPNKEPMIIFNENKRSTLEVEDKHKDNWVIVPPSIEDPVIQPPPTFPSLPIQCAANYGEDKTCCGQPPAIVPYSNMCQEDKPYCHGYVALKKWGTCQMEPLSSSPLQSEPTV